MLKKLFLLSSLFILSSCSVFGINRVEEAAYKVKLQEDKFEIRQYEDRIIAKTTVNEKDFKEANNKAFRRLGGFIFGKNTKDKKIAMTSPVVIEPKDSQKIKMTSPVFIEKNKNKQVMYFVMPSKYTLKTLPRPLDKNVKILKQKGKKMAAIRFSGFFSQEKLEKNTAKLQEWIAAKKLRAVSKPVYAGYNPPWTIPFFKRNEVLIEIK